MLICTLAQYLTWHLRRALAPLTYTDEHPPARANPVAPATRSTTADRKAARHTTTEATNPCAASAACSSTWDSYRSTITIGDRTFYKISTPTETQQRAFNLLGAPIPLSLAS